jgi:predicted secreted hydrolase
VSALLAFLAVALLLGVSRPIVAQDTHALVTPRVQHTNALVTPGVRLEFPRDEGSHPDYRIEWWYVTGWLDGGSKVGAASGGETPPRGFQVTFFRVRTGIAQDNPSAFAPKQVLFAHAALADPRHGRLHHAQRAAREGFGLAYAKQGELQVRLDDWSLRQVAPNRYRAVVQGDDFSFDLLLDATQPPLLQGEDGFSRKGPDPRAASYYYSLPQLAVSGEIAVDGRRERVNGRAWFDHEWSSDFVDERALGWDWMGINLHDGGALMSFRMRDKQGGERWAAATLSRPAPLSRPAGEGRGEGSAPSPAPAGEGRGEGGVMRQTFPPEQVEWTPLESWRSPRTGVEYPVRWRVQVGDRRYRVEPLMNDAELDSRATTGVLYWEGAVRLLDDATGRELGRGYLELTGYGGKVDI